MSDLNLGEFLDLADSWSALGWAVQGQLQAVIEGDDLDDQNPNALKMIRDFLAGTDFDEADELVEQIDAHLAVPS